MDFLPAWYWKNTGGARNINTKTTEYFISNIMFLHHQFVQIENNIFYGTVQGGEVRMRMKQQLWTNVPQILLAHVLYQQQLSSKTVHRVWEIT